jgi:SAM-dependent methyltransferase
VAFDADWLAARAPYDEAALDQPAIDAIRAWGARLPTGDAPVVVDLGSGTGVALDRARRWMAPRKIVAYAVDQDAGLLNRIIQPADGSRITPVVGDVLSPLGANGGPTDGTVDLVVGHALADLLPLDRLAARVSALLRPGGLVHLALVYDGLTAFEPTDDPDLDVDAGLEAEVIAAFHAHMDQPAREAPTYGGSTAGRRLGPALSDMGLEVLVDAPSVWKVCASDGAGGRAVLDRLIRYVAGSIRETGALPSADLGHWESRLRAALDTHTLTARVGHRDLLARKPGDTEHPREA